MLYSLFPMIRSKFHAKVESLCLGHKHCELSGSGITGQVQILPLDRVPHVFHISNELFIPRFEVQGRSKRKRLPHKLHQDRQLLEEQLYPWDFFGGTLNWQTFQFDKCCRETGNGCIDSYCSFLHVLLHCMKQLLEWHVISPAHRLHPYQEVRVRLPFSQAAIKTWSWVPYLDSSFGLHGIH